MSTMVEKRVQMTGDLAQRLDRLAAAQGTTPDALIEKALDLLFQTQPGEPNIPEELRADWELLQEMEEELGPMEPASIRTPPRFDLTKATVTHAVPVDPSKIRRLGEKR